MLPAPAETGAVAAAQPPCLWPCQAPAGLPAVRRQGHAPCCAEPSSMGM